MNRDDVIRMAREAGFTVGYGSPALEKHERFAQLVAAQEAAAEREACAQLVRDMGFAGWDVPTIADRIRNRGTA